jgi:hypothetical protein
LAKGGDFGARVSDFAETKDKAVQAAYELKSEGENLNYHSNRATNIDGHANKQSAALLENLGAYAQDESLKGLRPFQIEKQVRNRLHATHSLREIQATDLTIIQTLFSRFDDALQEMLTLKNRLASLQAEEDWVRYINVQARLMLQEAEVAELAIDLKTKLDMIDREDHESQLSEHDEL